MGLTAIVSLSSEQQQLVRRVFPAFVQGVGELMAMWAFSALEWEHDDEVHGFVGVSEGRELPVG